MMTTRPRPRTESAIQTTIASERVRDLLVAALDDLDTIDRFAHRADVASMIVARDSTVPAAQAIADLVRGLADHLRSLEQS